MKYNLFLLAVVLVASAMTAQAETSKEKFLFGSYGRVNFSSNLDGEKGYPRNVVRYGSRIDQGNYSELNFKYSLNHEGAKSAKEFNITTEFTIAMFDEFFHFTGDPISNMAIRNMYAYAENVIPGHLGIWAGSRMYRGDDIYLFDFWPLDNLNTMGAGADLIFGNRYILSWHMGFNRVKDKYYYQEYWTSSNIFGPTSVPYLDRQKMITSLKLEKLFLKTGTNSAGGDIGMKYKLYSEFHYVPAGSYLVNEYKEDIASNNEVLPSDLGFTIGAQFGWWNFTPNSFLNVFVRYSKGLAAYGEFGVPYGMDADKKVTSANEILVGLMLNWETSKVGTMFAAYYRRFVDADPNEIDLDDGHEFIVAVRPHIYVTDHFHQLFEFSYQMKNAYGINPVTTQHEKPAIFKAAVMPALSWSKWTFSRPQLRLVASLSYLNDAATNLYPMDHPGRKKNLELFLGVQAEWWFNSAYR